MFFLIRSAACIGAVAVLATGSNGTGLGRVIDGGERDAVQSLGRACVVPFDCLRLGMGVAATMGRTGPATAVVSTGRSHDTPTASDLSPAWAAPGGWRAEKDPHPHPGTLERL